MIPTPLTFQIIEQILPIMERACQISEMMSADKKPTIHLVITNLANMDGYLEKIARDGTQSFAKDYAEVLINELHRRFPNVGTDNELYCFGHILHPYFRGRLFKRGTQRWKDRYFSYFYTVIFGTFETFALLYRNFR